jgi:hypothetical protein
LKDESKVLKKSSDTSLSAMSADEDEAYVEAEEDPYQPVTNKLPNPEVEYWKYVLWGYFTNPWLIFGTILILYFYGYKRLKPRIQVRVFLMPKVQYRNFLT